MERLCEMGGGTVPRSGLPKVIVDIADRLIKNDWFQMVSDDESRSYYVIGVEDYYAGLSGEVTYRGMVVNTTTETGPYGEYFARSQVAGGHPDYLRRYRKRLEQAGGSRAAIDRFVAGDFSAFGDLNAELTDANRQTLVDFVQAFCLIRCREQGSPFRVDKEEVEEIDDRRAKLCLREVVTKYGKIVGRWEQLDALTFGDAQLEEASKTYLYGFYRASVVLCASALEQHLIRLAGPKGERTYTQLVEDAAAYYGLGIAWINQAREVFKMRNQVVHENHEPSHDEAGQVLSNARHVLAQISSDGQ
jgi:hypothetical protein